MIVDDRTPEQVEQTAGYWVATDAFMSGWGGAQGRSLVACPVLKGETFGTMSARQEYRMSKRQEFKRLRWCCTIPRLRAGDHLHIYSPESTWGVR
jgi:hypothetical protein